MGKERHFGGGLFYYFVCKINACRVYLLSRLLFFLSKSVLVEGFVVIFASSKIAFKKRKGKKEESQRHLLPLPLPFSSLLVGYN